MKIFINSGRIMKRFLLVGIVLCWLSCEEDRVITYDTSSGIVQQVSNPYLQVTTGFVPFKPDIEKYTISFNVINGVKAISKVNVYATFSDAGSKKTSQEILFETYNVTSPTRTVIEDELTYADLKKGLTVNGTSLPDDADAIIPGSGWSFRFEGVGPTGEAVPLIGAINIVLSKYAGIYEVIESAYVRGPEEYLGDWNGTEIFIGHIDDKTLSHNDYWGIFEWGGCAFNFEVDPDTKVVTAPILTECGLFSGVSSIGCAKEASSFKNLNAYLGYKVCEVNNIVIDDEVTGAHIIKLSYGYIGANGIPRAFTEVLRKKVD